MDTKIKQTIWEGLSFFDYMILPHYRSEHPESKYIDQEVKFCKENKKGGLGLQLFTRRGDSTGLANFVLVSTVSGVINRFIKMRVQMLPMSTALGSPRLLNIFGALLSLSAFKITKFSIHIQIRWLQVLLSYFGMFSPNPFTVP